MNLQVEYEGSLENADRLGDAASRALNELARALGFPAATIALVLVTDETISGLNRKYRNADGATDVLAFPYEDPRAARIGEGTDGEAEGESDLAGEIFVSAGSARRQAGERGFEYSQEVVRLFLHGALHLLGFDHDNAVSAREMRSEEERLLGALAETFRVDPVTLL